MMAIRTKYIGPTNFRGSRVKVFTETQSLTLRWNDALSSEENHTGAARILAERLDWRRFGTFYRGSFKDDGYVFVCALDTEKAF
jgi:hypothetical protein